VSGTLSWPPTGGVDISTLTRGAKRDQRSAYPTVSDRCVAALDQIDELRRRLIRTNPTGSYTALEYIKARAFVVLSHGAIEDYLEGICIEVVDAAIASFQADSKPRTALMALLHYGGHGDPGIVSTGGPWEIREALKRSRKQLLAWRDSNNGVKQADVLRLLLPVGLKESDMGATWLQTMSELGELRGAVAHHGHGPTARNPLDVKDALVKVQVVLPTLCRVDARLVALRDE
jgi:hypothetical protein